jgi:hypothetical protein
MLSNLPPGVSERDIPGNRPEDEAEERFYEEVHKRLADVVETGPLGQFTDDEDAEELVHQAIRVARDVAVEWAGEEAKQERAMGVTPVALFASEVSEALITTRDGLRSPDSTLHQSDYTRGRRVGLEDAARLVRNMAKGQ